MNVRATETTRDSDDIRLLLQTLDLHALDQVTAVARRLLPDEPLSDRSRLLAQDLLAQPEPRSR